MGLGQIFPSSLFWRMDFNILIYSTRKLASSSGIQGLHVHKAKINNV
jgi:hypothetical protein